MFRVNYLRHVQLVIFILNSFKFVYKIWRIHEWFKIIFNNKVRKLNSRDDIIYLVKKIRLNIP